MMLDDSGSLNCEEWYVGPPNKPKDGDFSYSSVSVADGDTTRPIFQINHKLKIHFKITPGYKKTVEEMPEARRNVELAIPRKLDWIHKFFAGWDKKAMQQVFDHQGRVWSKRKSKPVAFEDLIAEGVFLPSIADSDEHVEKGYVPTLRTKAVPVGKKTTVVWVVEMDNETGKQMVRRGSVDDLEAGDEIIPRIMAECVIFAKNEACYTYPIVECAVYKAGAGQTGGLKIPGMDGTVQSVADHLRDQQKEDAPVVKRVRSSSDDGETEAKGENDGGGGGTKSSSADSMPDDYEFEDEPDDVEIPEQEDF